VASAKRGMDMSSAGWVRLTIPVLVALAPMVALALVAGGAWPASAGPAADSAGGSASSDYIALSALAGLALVALSGGARYARRWWGR